MSLANALRILEMRQDSTGSKIRFHYLTPVRIPAGKVRALLTQLLGDYGKVPLTINYIFCTDRYLLRLNRGYLKHNTLTDIITFDLSNSKVEVIADVFISAERVRANAAGLALPFSKEILRVIIHGALHLVGLKDKSKSEVVAMRSAEDRYLSLLLPSSVPRITVSERNKVQGRSRQ